MLEPFQSGGNQRNLDLFRGEFHASSAHNVHMLHAITQLCSHVRWTSFGRSGSFCAATVPYVGFLSVLCLKFITASGLGNNVQRHLWRNSAGLDRERDSVRVCATTMWTFWQSASILHTYIKHGLLSLSLIFFKDHTRKRMSYFFLPWSRGVLLTDYGPKGRRGQKYMILSIFFCLSLFLCMHNI